MVYFKNCPRCGGDMHNNRDIYGAYKECLQCGLMVDIDKRSKTPAPAAAQSKRKKAA